MKKKASLLPPLRFNLRRLGWLESGSLEVKPLTLLCGPNNTGKTWVMYALYGFLHQINTTELPGLDSVSESLAQNGTVSWDFGRWVQENEEKLLTLIRRSMKKRLSRIFNSDPALFARSQFDWNLKPGELSASAIHRPLDFELDFGMEARGFKLTKPAGESILDITWLSALPIKQWLTIILATFLAGQLGQRRPFLMPAERNGLHLFFRELASRRAALLHPDSKKLLKEDIGSSYAEPIAHYIDWLNDLPVNRKSSHGPLHGLAEDLKKLVGGGYHVDAEGNITFTPENMRGDTDGDGSPAMELHLTSSTVKGLFGLWFYLEHQAQPGSVLMIDEPELNLHPSNQRALARLLARLVNAGVYVVASTHSDYLVREMNSLLMLSKPHHCRPELMKRFGYQETELLSPEQIGAYLFDKGTIAAMEVTPDEGIIATTFDSVINQLNQTSDEIFYTYRDEPSLGEEVTK